MATRVSKHMIVSMLHNDGYIATETTKKGTKRYVSYLRVADGSLKPWVCVPKAKLEALLEDGTIQEVEPGIFKLTISAPAWVKDLIVDDVTGAILSPGKPEICEGNGFHINVDGDAVECACDECDYLQLCFPEE